MSVGTVYLVGAGCGAADLITVRGLELLRRCDAVVYDDLIAPELLEAVPATAERIYMGKRSGAHSAPQEEITACLKKLARAGKNVIRLKGGDPFVFGRGGEEMEALLQAGIPCQYVPGVSSAVAIPAEAGIPVTHRGRSRSFHVITAHTADTPDGLPEDLDDLAGCSGTLVFLMGLRQLPKLAARLMVAGIPGSTPTAVVSGGNAPHPAAVRGTLADIAEKAKDVCPPAVIVVGSVSEMELMDRTLCPLQGAVVGLTGTDDMAGKLRPLLTELGARVFSAGRTKIRELPVSLEFLCQEHRWLVFTSSNGVRVFFRKLKEQKIDQRRFAHCNFAVIGAGTAATLSEYGIFPDLCPEQATTAALGNALIETVSSGEVCLLRSAQGSKELYETLSRRLMVRDIPLYEIEPDLEAARLAKPRLQEMDYLVFSSSSGVELYFETQGTVPEGTRCVCIGPVAAKALRSRLDRPFLVAEEISAKGITAAILQDWNCER